MAESMTGRRILVTADAVGGVWTYSLDLLRELSAAGVEGVLAVLGRTPSAAALREAGTIAGLDVVSTGLPLDWLAANSREVLDSGHAIAELARARHCDSVQLHTAALAVAGGFSQPVVSVHHSCVATWWRAVRPGEELPDDLRWRCELVAQGLAASDAVVAPTTALAHAMAEAYGLEVPPMVIRTGRHMPAHQAMTDVTARTPFALTSGRLWDGAKNAMTLDRAAARLAVPLVAAGDAAGPSGDARRFDHLKLAGQLDEACMRKLLAEAPIFVTAARYEPFGLGVLEAAQAGCALVLSDIPTFRELWSGACLFVAADDEQGFAAAIDSLLSDAALLRRMSRRALNRASHYSAGTMAAQMMRHHASLIALNRIGKGAAA